jgi:hypothetical protein
MAANSSFRLRRFEYESNLFLQIHKLNSCGANLIINPFWVSFEQRTTQEVGDARTVNMLAARVKQALRHRMVKRRFT